MGRTDFKGHVVLENNSPLRARNNADTADVDVLKLDTSDKLLVLQDLKLQADSRLVVFGAGDDADITYDGTDLVVNPRTVGSGNVNVEAGSVEVKTDNGKVLWGAGEDASVLYDGTDLVVDPREVGSGNLKLGAGSLEIKTDSGKVLWGAGEDASILYNGTDMVVDPREVGSGNLSMTTASLELKSDSMSLLLGAGEDASLQYDGTDLEVKPKLVGSGRVRVEGAVLVQKHEFQHHPAIMQEDGTIASGVDTEVNAHVFADGLVLYVQNIGTQTILAPAVNASGLNYAYDQTNSEGVQWVMRKTGSKGILNKDYFTVGTSPAFFASLKFSIATVAGTTDCAFGFRKDEAFRAAIDDYDEMAALNVISGDIKIETILNNGATTTTDTTDNWANAATHTLAVKVSAAGVVTYEIDGAAPTVTAAFTFDSAEVVTPCAFLLQAAGAVTGAIVLQELEAGLQ